MVKINKDTLGAPAPLVIQKLGTDYLKSADKALARLEKNDPEALHDFRVSLRKLRSLLQAYNNALPHPLKLEHIKVLRKLFAATGRSRDREVQIMWLARHRDQSINEASWKSLIEKLIKPTGTTTSLYPLLKDQFPPLKKALTKALKQLNLSNQNGTEQSRSFGKICRLQSVRFSERLWRNIKGLSTLDEYALIHQSRINCKKLRYLLEPLAPINNTLSRDVDRLKSLQDVLGDIHDLEILIDQLSTLGIPKTLTRQQLAEANRLIAKLKDDCRSKRQQLRQLLNHKKRFHLTRDVTKALG